MAVGCDVALSQFNLERRSIETVSCYKYIGSYSAKVGALAWKSRTGLRLHKLKMYWKDAHVWEATKGVSGHGTGCCPVCM